VALKGISELEGLDFLEILAEKYEDSTGLPPFDLSHWDPSDETIRYLTKYLILPPPPLYAPYVYPYYVGAQERVIQRLGFREETRNCLFAQAGTNATLLATWWLKVLNIDRILVLCPAYFPVFYSAEMLGIPCTKIYLDRTNGEWRLPVEQIKTAVQESPSNTAIWVTNPIYCTGVYFSDPDIEFLNSLIGEGIKIVADECLSIGGKEIGRHLGDSSNFLGFYSPHKSICMNAIKFAAIIYDSKYEEFFDHWSDVILGGLTSSNHSAIFHFLSDNFPNYQTAFFHRIEEARERIEKIVTTDSNLFETDKNFSGHFMMLYAPEISAIKGRDKLFLEQLIFDTGATIIPGPRNHFDLKFGFSFRINLARGSPQFFSAFKRLIRFFEGSGTE
jgi:aspartate/methionine/tyrosine aminotransferase